MHILHKSKMAGQFINRLRPFLYIFIVVLIYVAFVRTFLSNDDTSTAKMKTTATAVPVPSATPLTTAKAITSIPMTESPLLLRVAEIHTTNETSKTAAMETATTTTEEPFDETAWLAAEPILRNPSVSTNTFFASTLLLVMLSPSRFPFIPELIRNYKPGFRNIMFFGPRNHTFVLHGEGGETDEANKMMKKKTYRVTGLPTIFGNLQYIATVYAMEMTKNTDFTGYFFCNDDMMLHYWSFAEKQRRLDVPWTSQRGVGYLGSTKHVKAVSGMSYELSHRGVWPFWRQGTRVRLAAVLRKCGADAQKNLAHAVRATDGHTKAESVYLEGTYDHHDVNFRQWSVFYTIVDAYYVPKSAAPLFIRYISEMKEKGIHQELAVPTVLAMIDGGKYEMLNIHYYWGKHKG